MNGAIRRRYEALIEAQHLTPDVAQQELADRLDVLVDALAENRLRSKKSALGWLFAGSAKPPPVRGLYIWGPVGRGKTMLMDWFYEAAPGRGKRRVHFHEFMGDVHDRINAYRQAMRDGTTGARDPIPPVGDAIAGESRLLCFDEFSVTDIADAMILGRLFDHLFKRRVTVIATSNTRPRDLYRNGLNRPLFVPFIELIERHMAIFHLDASQDFRLDKLASEPIYIVADGEVAAGILDAHFHSLTGVARGEPATILHKGRELAVPEAAGGVARFTFDALCARPLGARDYLKIARRYHTLIISGVPVMDQASRNEARRFINLIDTLYDEGVKLIIAAAAEPDDLWRGSTGHETAEFARTASRLHEMRSNAYLAAPRKTAASDAAA